MKAPHGCEVKPCGLCRKRARRKVFRVEILALVPQGADLYVRAASARAARKLAADHVMKLIVEGNFATLDWKTDNGVEREDVAPSRRWYVEPLDDETEVYPDEEVIDGDE